VSLLSPDTLSLYITPDRVQAVKTVGLSRRAVEVRQREASVQAADNWQGLIRVVGELALQTKAQRLHIVLSDKLARYACFPWSPELRNVNEDMSMAMLNFDDVYGANKSAEWHIALSEGRPGQSRISIAIPKSLYEVLQSNFEQSRPKVTSIQTAFTAVLQTHRRRLGRDGWLINLEEGRLTLASWANDSWKWIYSVHAKVNSPEELLARIRQEIQLSSTSLKAENPVPIYLHAPAFEHLPFGALHGVEFVPLKTIDKEAGAKYSFALLGVRP
jgi:hypothetical protein